MKLKPTGGCEHVLIDMGPDVKDPRRYDKKMCTKCKCIFYKFKPKEEPHAV